MNEAITADRIRAACDKVQALCDAATPGPWVAYPSEDAVDEYRDCEDLDCWEDTSEAEPPGVGMGSYLQDRHCYNSNHRIEYSDTADPRDKDWPETIGNIRLIAASRTLLPAMLPAMRVYACMAEAYAAETTHSDAGYDSHLASSLAAARAFVEAVEAL